MSKQTQGLAAVMPSTEELKTAGIRELSAEELLEVNGGRQVEGAINPYGPDPDIPDDPPSSSGNSNTSDDSSSDSGSTETSSGSSIDSSSNTSEDTSSSSSSDTSDDNSSDSSSNASEDTSSSSTSDTSNDSSSDSNSSSGSSSNASEDTSSSSSSDTSNDSSSDSYEDEECGNYDNSSSDTGSNASENTSSNNSYSPDYEDEEPGSYDNSCNNPDAGSSDSSSSSSSYPDKDNNDSYAKNHSESSSGNSAETNRKREAYIVQKGDTLSDIVRRHYPDASSDEIRRLVKETAKNSGITDVNKLEIGQTVFFTERQDGAKTGTKQTEAETKTQSLKEQFKNISETGNTQAMKKDASAIGSKRSPGTIKDTFSDLPNGMMGQGEKTQESVGQEETSLKHDDKGRVAVSPTKEIHSQNNVIKNTTLKERICPLKGNVRITGAFGSSPGNIGRKENIPDTHAAVDMVSDTREAVAAKDGVIKYAGLHPDGMDAATGTLILIQYTDKTFALYGHMDPNDISVTEGASVTQGQTLGKYYDGIMGKSTGGHLHYAEFGEIMEPRTKEDLARLFNGTGYFYDQPTVPPDKKVINSFKQPLQVIEPVW